MSLSDLVNDSGATPLDIENHLNKLTHDQRLGEVRGLSAKQVKALYHRSAESPGLSLDFFIPEGTSPGQPVVHHGINSLPAFRSFQKVFIQAGDVVTGYNEQTMRWATGPGYFVCRDVESGALQSRGKVVIDYFMVPGSDVTLPEGWPTVAPNTRGISFFVYANMRDYMRRVSAHVSVGAAFKKEQDKEMGAYFVLCRED